MVEPKRDNKEIRLFGEKSLREEAYRQKILQLEQEIARMESLAKNSRLLNSKEESPTVHLDGLYHESLISFDKRVKKEHEFFERRASEVTERLDMKAQQLALKLESSFRKKTRWFIIPILLIICSSAFIFFTAQLFYKSNNGGLSLIRNVQNASYINRDDTFYRRLSYAKRALQTHTIYRNQYEVSYLDLLNGVYAAEIELNSPQTDKWFLKKLSSDLINVFQRYISDAPAEFSILYRGKLLSKAYLTVNPTDVRFQFFSGIITNP